MTGNRRFQTSSSLYPQAAYIGFDHLFKELDHVTKHAHDHYPPHNIIVTGPDDYLIELAVAGFSKEGIDIVMHERTLTITGEHVKKGREYVHRGISTKKFKRTFRLSEHVHVHGADIVDGILAISLKVIVPEDQRPRKINIGTNEESKNEPNQLLNESN
jgi:molecular chaperone IbpA|tara:strand:+ start:3003 stop:3479 length:477 start_codon:yes stop_codon:yes gene_type:complete